jgi:hypothetical protein
MGIGKISVVVLLAVLISIPAHAQGAYGTSAKVQKNRQTPIKQTYSGMKYPYAQPAPTSMKEVAPGSTNIYPVPIENDSSGTWSFRRAY